jgi:hypothetical protein
MRDQVRLLVVENDGWARRARDKQGDTREEQDASGAVHPNTRDKILRWRSLEVSFRLEP